MHASPEVIDRKSCRHQAEADEALAHIARDLVRDDREADERERDAHERESAGVKRRTVPARAAQRDRTERERAEENPLGVDEARADLAVRAGQEEHRRPEALHPDPPTPRSVLWIDGPH